MLWPKKNSYKEFDNEKNSCGSKIPLPPPPHNFSNGPSLKIKLQFILMIIQCNDYNGQSSVISMIW